MGEQNTVKDANKNLHISEEHESNDHVFAKDYSLQAKELFKTTDVFRNRIMRIKRTIRRLYPDIVNERKKAREWISNRIATVRESPINEIGEVERTQLIEMLTDIKTPFDRVFIRGMFLSIFSELDAFTEAFLTSLFELKPDIMLGNQKQVNASEVFECDSIERLKEKVIQKEIETIKRDSYIDQIYYLERTFNIETLRKFQNWSKYVEITQRRNLIMHNDGITNEQYIKVCGSNGVTCDMKVGQELYLDFDYLMEAISVIEEVSLKLIQTLWRKCFPDNTLLGEFDDILNQTIYSILDDGEWSLAKELGDYACKLKEQEPEFEMMFLINYCIALKNLKEDKKVAELLKRISSIMDQEFVLAKFVLQNDLENTIRMMKKVGTEGTYFRRETYPIFPLFSDMRKEKIFRDTYKSLFGEDIDKKEIDTRIEDAEKADEEGPAVPSSTDNTPLITF